MSSTALEAIPLITSSLTLVSFIAALVAISYWRRLQAKEKEIQLSPDGDRAEVIRRNAEFFDIPLDGLTKAQRTEIILAQINQKANRYIAACILAVVLASIFGYVTIAGIKSDTTNTQSLPNAKQISEIEIDLRDLQTKLDELDLQISNKLADYKNRMTTVRTLREQVNRLNSSGQTQQAKSVRQQISTIMSDAPSVTTDEMTRKQNLEYAISKKTELLALLNSKQS